MSAGRVGAVLAGAALAGCWLVGFGTNATLDLDSVGLPRPAVLQAQGRGRGAQQPPVGRGFPAQQRELPPPEVIEHGRALYSVSCSACHGADLRGGQLGGPNLLRSAVVLADDLVDQLGPIVDGSRADRGMPAMAMSPDEVTAVAAYLHSIIATSRRQGAPPPGPSVELDVLVGDPAAGEVYFAAECSSCHSATGDLGGLAARVSDPRELQNLWVSGGGVRGRANDPERAVTVVVTEASGERTEGRLVRYDDFALTLSTADGTVRTFRRDGDRPVIEFRDPLARHQELLGAYTNQIMHDVTAYLATLK